MSEFAIAVLVISSVVLGIGVFSNVIRSSLVSAPLIALLVGVLFGPHVLGVLDIREWGDQFALLMDASWVTLAFGLMGIALRLPRGEVFRRARPLAVLLGLVMPIMWLVSSLLVFFVLGVPAGVALLAGASITPTDPILARTITEGPLARRASPPRMRNTLLAESAINDGLGFPFVTLSVLLLSGPLVEVASLWFRQIVLWSVLGGIALGLLIGYGAGRLLGWAQQRRLIADSFLLAYPLALSLFALSAVRLLQADGILAVFAAGVAFLATGSVCELSRAEQVQEMIDHFFSLPIFVLLGLALPWDAWLAMGWRALAVVVGVLVLRRLPVVILSRGLMQATIWTLPEAAFVGWFGPMGVSALFYAALAVQITGIFSVWVVVSLLIVSSVVVFGVTASPFTRLLGKHEGRRGVTP